MTALALFVVTAALAVLLAVLFHLAWPPVLVSIVGTVPALYLAWLAVPGVISARKGRPMAAGRRSGTPVELGVHQVIGGGPMPAYVRRPHDELLRAVLDPAVPASRLVVVRGGSSTGKTRAAYEAVADRLAGWQLDYPLDPAALKERLEAGIPARTVLWLGELRQYADADGGAAVLGRLADLLKVRAAWSSPPCGPSSGTLTPPRRAPGPDAADPAGTAGRLLERLPELTGRDPAADRSRPRRGHRRPGPVHHRRPGKPRPAPATRCWRKRPRRPRAPGKTGRSPSTWPGSPTCWTVMTGPAVTPTARRSSPRRWTPPGSATPARCPPRCCRRPRSGT